MRRLNSSHGFVLARLIGGFRQKNKNMIVNLMMYTKRRTIQVEMIPPLGTKLIRFSATKNFAVCESKYSTFRISGFNLSHT